MATSLMAAPTKKNPGGTDVFGRAADTENGAYVERFWIRYKFEGTPLTLFVGAELKKWVRWGSLAMTTRALVSRLEFGNLQLSAKAYMEREAQRLGLTNDNDLVSYAFTAAYDLRRTVSRRMWCGSGTASLGRTRRRWV